MQVLILTSYTVVTDDYASTVIDAVYTAKDGVRIPSSEQLRTQYLRWLKKKNPDWFYSSGVIKTGTNAHRDFPKWLVTHKGYKKIGYRII